MAHHRDDKEQVYLLYIQTEYCSNTYGQAPCTASGAVGTECRNTYKTCQDKANFVQETLTYGFISSRASIPVGIINLPCIVDVTLTPTTKQKESGLSVFTSATIKCKDFPWHDRNSDPYWETRPFKYDDQGTFWGRFLASNPYLIGQWASLYTGYIQDLPSLSEFDRHAFFVETIDGPDSRGEVIIKLRDPLKDLEDGGYTWPEITDSELTEDIDAVQTSIKVTDITPFQPAPGYVSINNEEIYYTTTHTGQSELRNCVRGFNGISGAHKAGDTVQEGQEIPPTNCVDLAYDILMAAGVDPTYINLSEWNAIRDKWYVGFNCERRIYDPTKLLDLLRGLCEDTAMSIWYDSRAQKIKLKQIAPSQGGKELTDDIMLADSLKVIAADNLRLNEGWYYYQPRDYVDQRDRPVDFRRLYINAQPYGQFEYPDNRERETYAAWISENGINVARTVTSRMLSRYRETPVLVYFALDADDADIWTGDDIIFDSHVLQDAFGRNLRINAEIYEAKEKNGRYEYKAIFTGLASGRNMVIGPNTLQSYALESELNRNAYGFISDDSGLMSDDTVGYRIQ